MADDSSKTTLPGASLFSDMLRLQAELAQGLASHVGQIASPTSLTTENPLLAGWADYAGQVGKLWQDAGSALAGADLKAFVDPAKWRELVDAWYANLPLADEKTREGLVADSLQLWNSILAQYGVGAKDNAEDHPVALPRKDRRFADPRWRDQPVFAVIHQSYLLLAEQLQGLVDKAEGLDPARKDQLRFTLRTLVEALSPANFALTNPVVLERTLETRGENLVQGMEHLLSDVARGQLTHTDKAAFELGRNIAATPGKVVYETPLFQLIQYTPTTPAVLETPLVIFPPWINRFYILDLNPQKSFVRWAVEQGITVFMVSSADFHDTMNTLIPWSSAQATKLFLGLRSRM